jgi:hypothetical protein
VSRPVRYGSRYGSTPLSQSSLSCRTCGTPLRSARAHYCSPGCRQRAYRLRHLDLPTGDPSGRAADLQRRQRLVAQTIYECPQCGERYLGERRCGDCNRFCRVLGLGGACPHCDQPILAAELLGEEGRP